jgi:hypothetical protein
MANNIIVKDGNGALVTIESLDVGGVQQPGHRILTLPADPMGASADAAVISDNAGSISAKLRGLNKQLAIQFPATLGQKVMAQSLPVTIASDQSGGSIGALSAGENHIGQVTKPFTVTVPTLAITPSSAYPQGYCVGGALEFTNAARIADGTGTIISILLVDANQQNAEYTLLLFDADPTTSNFVDGTLAILDPADFDILLGSVELSTYISIGGTISPASARSFVRVKTDIPFVLASGRSVYGVLVVKDTTHQPTYHSSSSLSMRMWVDQN